MAKDTHVTAPTRFLEANGIHYAYRRFGSESGTPLVFLQHFRGGLDNWDPLVTDGLAQGRPVILFNNAGVASSSGETPDTVDAMGDHLALFVNLIEIFSGFARPPCEPPFSLISSQADGRFLSAI